MSARTRLWLLFAALALTTTAALPGSLWLADRWPGPAPLYGLAVALPLLTVQALIWLGLDRSWLQPSARLARELQLLLHANPERPIVAPAGHGLGELVPAVQALAERWRTSRAEHTERLALAVARAREQQSRLEAVLRDLSDGLIVCAADRRILLFNDAALRIFGGHPEFGLDRPLQRLIAREPIAHAFELLRERSTDAAPGRAGEERAEFVCATADGGRLLRCRMALILDAEGEASGFVLDLTDATVQIDRLERRNARLAELVQAQRAPVAAIRAAAEVLAGRDALPPAEWAAFVGVLERESTGLSAKVEALCAAADELTAGDWPRSDLFSADLTRWVNRRLASAAPGLALTPVGAGLWLHGDGYHLSLLLERLARLICAATGASGLDLEVQERGQRVELDLVWPGLPLAVGRLEAWLDQGLDQGLDQALDQQLDQAPDLGRGQGVDGALDGGATGGWRLRDVLRRHQSELWSQAHPRAGHALLRLPLPGPSRPKAGVRGRAQRLPPRPEFYDFELLARGGQRSAPLLERPLGALGYVVFDTETTGLEPAGGDRVIQIAGVRIVNRRLLTGEVFEALIDPGRPIPKASIRFHGITDQMVRGRPPLEIVLPQFHSFAEGSVLVAHNAAFDMAFLRRDEDRLGVRFDQPVLDTLLLSAMLHDHTPDHSLDAIAARFGIALARRHQALGDAIGTGQIFLGMLELLEARGVRSLGDALALADRAVALRRRQAAEFGPRRGLRSERAAGA